jgi:outer membrane receptor for ferrienterochelin and colicins
MPKFRSLRRAAAAPDARRACAPENRTPSGAPHLAGLLTLCLSALAAASAAQAQAPVPAPAPAPAAAPAPAPAPVPGAAGSPPAGPRQQIEITGGRQSDVDQRRQATAAKIVIGREEIDKFGDASLGEVLRRLPGVTVPGGGPGRGGPPRMRGLGGGFTQLLIDGQRVPPGFSFDSLTPDQIERIEILRAPTAETGARAIAGTINIITREGFRRRLNDLRMGLSTENGRVTPGLFWTRNDSAGPLTYNLNAGAFRNRRGDEGSGLTTETDLADGSPVRREETAFSSESRTVGLNLGARLQWRLGEGGDMLVLNPNVFHRASDTATAGTRSVPLPGPVELRPYDRSATDADSAFTSARLALQWRQRLSPSTRAEISGNLGEFRSRNESLRQEFVTGQGAPLRTTDDLARTRDRSLNLTGKLSSTLGGSPDRPGSEHSLVSGLELETVQRAETRRTLENGALQLPDFGDELSSRTLRVAAYIQDEWAITPRWAVHAGLRWEGIRTEGDEGLAGEDRPVNTSRVATPLVHVLFKPDPAKRDQLRLSLTRSYRSPSAGQLIARPRVNGRFPASGPNTPTAPDSAGNPGLQPELATGIDLAWERYFDAGAVFSINLFHRRITDLVRNVTVLESVPYSPVPRHVSRPQNIGNATTQGVEMDTRFRLDRVVAGAPRTEMRGNLALYRSSVDDVPGPDNRLADQARMTLNLGADHRLRGTPFTLGGNLNLVPGYRTQQTVDRATTTDRQRTLDLYGLWTVNPGLSLRLTASNVTADDRIAVNEVDFLREGRTLRERGESTSRGATNLQLRFEFRL